MSAVDDVVAACRDRRRLADAIERKDRVLARLVKQEGRTAAQAAAEVEAALRADGFTDADIKAAGVSFASIKSAVRRVPSG